MPRRRSEHGFYLIGVLLALVVMCYLVIGYFEKDAKTGVSTYNASIGAANRAACLTNQQVFATELMRWSQNHPGKAPTVENLENSIPPMVVLQCPGKGVDHGTITITEDAQVYCSVHNPQPMPPPTPTPPPAIDFLATPAAEDNGAATPAAAAE